MGTPVRFRPRARGCATKEEFTPPFEMTTVDVVSWLEPNIKFVKGVYMAPPSAGEVTCGPDTEFPLQVTREQLFEMMYRVKDARLTGELSSYYSFGAGVSIHANTVDPKGQPFVFDDGGTVRLVRSYGTDYTDETEIWTGTPTPPPFGNWFADYFANGLSLYGSSDGDGPSGVNYMIYGWEPYLNVPAHAVYLRLEFSGVVAFVDTMGNGNPFDPGNQLYVGCYFDAYGEENLALVEATSLPSSTPVGVGASCGSLTIRLHSGDVEIPLFFVNTINTTYSTLVLIATEWWPYAHDNGDPMWDEDEGFFLAQQGAQMDFSDAGQSFNIPLL